MGGGVCQMTGECSMLNSVGVEVGLFDPFYCDIVLAMCF